MGLFAQDILLLEHTGLTFSIQRIPTNFFTAVRNILGTNIGQGTEENSGWNHIAIRSLNGELESSLNGAGFSKGTRALDAVFQAPVKVSVGHSDLLAVDEVWIGKPAISSLVLRAMYCNQAQKLSNPPRDLLVVRAELIAPQ